MTRTLHKGALGCVGSQARAMRGPWQSVASIKRTFKRTPTHPKPWEPWGQANKGGARTVLLRMAVCLVGLPSQPQPQTEKNTRRLLGQPSPKDQRGKCAGKERSLSFNFWLSILLAGFIIIPTDQQSDTIIHTVGDMPLELVTLILHYFILIVWIFSI